VAKKGVVRSWMQGNFKKIFNFFGFCVIFSFFVVAVLASAI
jgi:hypothetical protein